MYEASKQYITVHFVPLTPLPLYWHKPQNHLLRILGLFSELGK